jgi:hypothetical protein
MELGKKSFPIEFQRAFYTGITYKGGSIQTRPRAITENEGSTEIRWPDGYEPQSKKRNVQWKHQKYLMRNCTEGPKV